MKFRFPIVIIDEDFRSENTSGLGIRALAKAMEEEGMEVLGVTSYGDLSQFAQQQSRASAFILSIDDEEFTPGPELDPAVLNLRTFIEEIRFRNADIPIYLYGETRTSRHIPNDILRELHGFIHMFEDTPEFVARHIIREARAYLDGLSPPFFRALVHYAQDGSYSWHCPGHSGGVAFLKSPVGQMFHQFFGENMLRADVCNAVDELGQLLDHRAGGGVGAQCGAHLRRPTIAFSSPTPRLRTRWCGAPTSRRTISSSSTATATCRFCAITMTGAIPVFPRRRATISESLARSRGGVRTGECPEENRGQFVRARGEAEEAAHPHHHPEHLRWRGLQRRDAEADAEFLHRHAALRRGLAAARDVSRFLQEHARHRPRPAAHQGVDHLRHPLHAQAAGGNLAGVADSGAGIETKTRPARLQRGLPVHTSTSPQYAIIASCDGAAAMMEPPGGTALVEESILEALDFRRAMRKVDAEWGKDWWFKVWGPEKIAAEGIGSREDWVLKKKKKWHGFGNLASGFNMLDPIKATVITPGLDVSGKFAKTGIPAAIVTRYLAEHGVIVEKTGLYSFFIMFTIGITKGRWNTLVTALQQFKDDYDKNQPIWRVLTEFCQKHPRYEKMGLRDLCEQIHGMYKANDVARVTTEMYLSDMQPAMKPSDAFAAMAHHEIDRVEIDKLEGRVTSVLVTPYPPGIPLLIPGERFNATIVRYLQFARDFNTRFPGFETDIHGLVKDEDGRYHVDCVRQA
jgi:arginine/lysine/ornithine decarboxylase